MATHGWEGVTRRELATLSAQPPRAKYHNVKTVVDGLQFDSRAEGQYWSMLRVRERAGEIFDLRRQVSFPLYTVDRRGTTDQLLHVATYVADFVYYDRALGASTQRHVVDVKSKGTQTRVYLLKRKWLELQEGITIEEVTG